MEIDGEELGGNINPFRIERNEKCTIQGRMIKKGGALNFANFIAFT
jgi:hypothetical protein